MNKDLANSKKVLFCLHYSGLNNGAVRSLIDVVEVLIKEYNVQAFIIYPDKRGNAINYLESLGAICIHIPFYRVDYYKKGITFSGRIKKEISYAIKKIVSPYSFYCAKKVVFEYGVNIIYTNTIVIDYGICISTKMGIPHVWHIREFGKEDHGLSLRKGERNLYKNMEKSKAIIYISSAIANKYRPNMKQNVPQYVIHNDISKIFINPRKSYNMDSLNPLHAAIIGTIQEGKGQLEAIRAVEIVNKDFLKVILHIAGKKEGIYYKELLSYVKKKNLEHYIFFDGFIEDVNSYRSKMDIGIVASANEAFGRVTIEGMLSELAIIGANEAGTLELIEDGVNGVLYQKGNEVQLEKILNQFFNNRNMMKQIAETGYKQAVDKYTTHRAAKEIATLLNKM